MSVSNAHQGFVVGDGKHPGTCQKCGESFEGIRPGMTLCISCWYSSEMDDATERFAPLREVANEIGWRSEVAQTGGMVMCFAAYPTAETTPYIMWSDPEEQGDYLGFCVYIQDEDTCQDLIVEVASRDRADLVRLLQTGWDDILAIAKSRTVTTIDR